MALNAFDLVKALPHGQAAVKLENGLKHWHNRLTEEDALAVILEKEPMPTRAAVRRETSSHFENNVTVDDIRRARGASRLKTEILFYGIAVVVGAFAVYMAGLPMFDTPTHNDLTDKMHELATVLSELSTMARSVGYSY